MKSLALLLALFLASPLVGADIEAPDKAPEHTLVELRCTTKGKGYAWQVIGEGLLPVKVKVDSGDKSQATFTGKPGRYVAMVFVLTGDGDSVGLDQGQHFVEIERSGPAPPVVVIPPGPGPVVPPVTTDAPTMATYVYEKDMTAVSPEVMAALNMLNRGQRLGWKPGDPLKGKLLSTAFEDDTRNGNGEIPPQYKVAHSAASTAGLPALVIQAGNKVLRVVKAPTTAQQVLEAVP